MFTQFSRQTNQQVMDGHVWTPASGKNTDLHAIAGLTRHQTTPNLHFQRVLNHTQQPQKSTWAKCIKHTEHDIWLMSIYKSYLPVRSFNK